MTTAVSSTASSSTPTVSAKPQPVTSKDVEKVVTPPAGSTKVTISAAAKTAAQAAIQEATETATQSAQEARGGDRQAQRLLAHQAATQALLKPATA